MTKIEAMHMMSRRLLWSALLEPHKYFNTVYREPYTVNRIVFHLSVVCSSVVQGRSTQDDRDPISYLRSKNLKRHRSLSYNAQNCPQG